MRKESPCSARRETWADGNGDFVDNLDVLRCTGDSPPYKASKSYIRQHRDNGTVRGFRSDRSTGAAPDDTRRDSGLGQTSR